MTNGAKVKAELQAEKLAQEINQLREEIFEVKKQNHHLKMDLKRTKLS